MLPDPKFTLVQDIVWTKARRHMDGANQGLFFRVSEGREVDPNVTKATLRGGRLHSLCEIEEEIINSYTGHHQYDWVRPRGTWLDAKCPVYIDFGNEHLVKLGTYDDSGLPCVYLVAKGKFLYDSMSEKRAEDIAMHF